MRTSIQSAIARDKKSGFLDRKSTMGQYSNE
jgi:ribosomal protein L34